MGPNCMRGQWFKEGVSRSLLAPESNEKEKKSGRKMGNNDGQGSRGLQCMGGVQEGQNLISTRRSQH